MTKASLMSPASDPFNPFHTSTSSSNFPAPMETQPWLLAMNRSESTNQYTREPSYEYSPLVGRPLSSSPTPTSPSSVASPKPLTAKPRRSGRHCQHASSNSIDGYSKRDSSQFSIPYRQQSLDESRLSRYNNNNTNGHRSHQTQLHKDLFTKGSDSILAHTPTSTMATTTTMTLSNYKTEFCTKFRETGQCPFGDRCQFVHHDHELQKRSRALTYKTQACWSGSDCPYQQNHSRCIYLHGDETAEMFDQQRGITFERVKKILLSKELRQQQRRHNSCKGLNRQQQQGRQSHGPLQQQHRFQQRPSSRGSRSMYESNYQDDDGSELPYCSSSESSRPGSVNEDTFPGEHSSGHLDAAGAGASASSVPQFFYHLPRSFRSSSLWSRPNAPKISPLDSLPPRYSTELSTTVNASHAVEPLTWPPPPPLSLDTTLPQSSSTFPRTVTTSSLSLSVSLFAPGPQELLDTSLMAKEENGSSKAMADLFSPGMPTIDLPFGSPRQIGQWEDPCFEESAPPTLLARVDPLVLKVPYNIDGENLESLKQVPVVVENQEERHDVEGTAWPVEALQLLKLGSSPNAHRPVGASSMAGIPLTSVGPTIKARRGVTSLLSGIISKRNSAGYGNQFALSLKWSATANAPTSPVGHYKLW